MGYPSCRKASQWSANMSFILNDLPINTTNIFITKDNKGIKIKDKLI
jgi:hypothetical protein